MDSHCRDNLKGGHIHFAPKIIGSSHLKCENIEGQRRSAKKFHGCVIFFPLLGMLLANTPFWMPIKHPPNTEMMMKTISMMLTTTTTTMIVTIVETMTMTMTMMTMTFIRPRHSPLHPDAVEALENTHSRRGTSHAPVF